jgi:nicotinamidase/pyrazinamidase
MAEQQQAIVLVDLQADFTEFKNGALPVPGTDRDYVEQVIARSMAFKNDGIPIVATRDYHPANHASFYTNHSGKQPFDLVLIEGRRQVLWPPHCVEGTPGSEILFPEHALTAIIMKGSCPEFDSYSGFQDDGGRWTDMKEKLELLGVQELVIYGLATDYCVRATAIQAIELNYRVKVHLDLCRGVTPETTKAAIEEMLTAGAEIQ